MSFTPEDFATDPILIAAREAAFRSRREQGLPPYVTDPATIAKIAAICQPPATLEPRKAA